LFFEPAALFESDGEVEFVSVSEISPAVGRSPDGGDGASVGAFGESNSIGPRTVGLSVRFEVASSVVSRALGLAFGFGFGFGFGPDGVVSD
jgi:hypothetical protein